MQKCMHAVAQLKSRRNKINVAAKSRRAAHAQRIRLFVDKEHNYSSSGHWPSIHTSVVGGVSHTLIRAQINFPTTMLDVCLCRCGTKGCYIYIYCLGRCIVEIESCGGDFAGDNGVSTRTTSTTKKKTSSTAHCTQHFVCLAVKFCILS